MEKNAVNLEMKLNLNIKNHFQKNQIQTSRQIYN
jgi:hypothetical protein